MSPLSKWIIHAGVAGMLALALLATGCDNKPATSAVLDNEYPPSPATPLVVYRAIWQAVSFEQPVVPGSSSDAEETVPASDNTAYALLAPGWDAGTAAPTSFVVLESRNGFAVHLNETLHIPVDDQTFSGNCMAGSFLSQPQADLITQLVFSGDFANMSYEAASCTTTATDDAGAP